VELLDAMGFHVRGFGANGGLDPAKGGAPAPRPARAVTCGCWAPGAADSRSAAWAGRGGAEHETVPIKGVDALNATARPRTPKDTALCVPYDAPRTTQVRWRTAGGATRSLVGLAAGEYMVRAYLSGPAILYSLTFQAC
jgi:hypothetical protein